MNRERLQRGYDPRGTYPDQINEKIYTQLGYFFGNKLKGTTVAVGYDARTSSIPLKNACIEGLIQSGKNIIDLGLCSTDMLTFSTGYYDDIDAGIMITASHNPPQYNGLKICEKNAHPINVKEISDEIIAFLENENTLINSLGQGKQGQGKKEERNIINDWIKHVISFVNPDNIKPLKIVVDAGNGTAGIFIGELLTQLGCEVTPLYFNPDGNFPNHEANPMKSENVKDMIQKVQEIRADIGVAFDGDADRVMVCDENGIMLSGSIVTAIIAENILQKHPRSSIVYNTVCGRIVPDTITKFGGISIRSKVGHTYIKHLMHLNPNIVFAGEHSAHYFFKNNWNADSGSIALVVLLETLSQKRKNVSTMRKHYDTYVAIPETNFEINDTTPIYTALKKHFEDDGEISEEDGLLINYPQRRCNIRPSSNEPLIRLNLEAETQEILDIHFAKIQEIIQSNT